MYFLHEVRDEESQSTAKKDIEDMEESRNIMFIKYQKKNIRKFVRFSRTHRNIHHIFETEFIESKCKKSKLCLKREVNAWRDL